VFCLKVGEEINIRIFAIQSLDWRGLYRLQDYLALFEPEMELGTGPKP
jgi:hypothetical protein